MHKTGNSSIRAISRLNNWWRYLWIELIANLIEAIRQTVFDFFSCMLNSDRIVSSTKFASAMRICRSLQKRLVPRCYLEGLRSVTFSDSLTMRMYLSKNSVKTCSLVYGLMKVWICSISRLMKALKGSTLKSTSSLNSFCSTNIAFSTAILTSEQGFSEMNWSNLATICCVIIVRLLTRSLISMMSYKCLWIYSSLSRVVSWVSFV